jgi:hypothetical protein
VLDRTGLVHGEKTARSIAGRAVYHASMMPPPNELGPVDVDRKAAMAAVDLLETPGQARQRVAAGLAAPRHYTASPPVDATTEQRAAVFNPYK